MLDVQRAMRSAGSPLRAASSLRFFKTGPGDYGEGDQFLGLTVPQVRGFIPSCRDLPASQLEQLLHSCWHEERLLALLLLVKRFAQDPVGIYKFYLENVARWVNNWDLVDTSAAQIVGGFLLTQPDRSVLLRLAQSGNLWERRVAVIATFAFIRAGQFEDTLCLCEMLLGDRHDLMHKACGWMLREVGKRDRDVLELFLKQWAGRMPRTMLRYAIEKLNPERRQHYLKDVLRTFDLEEKAASGRSRRSR